jgi:hypothetical protein
MGEVERGTHEQFNPFSEFRLCSPCLDRIDWNPITSPNKDPLVVDLEIE